MDKTALESQVRQVARAREQAQKLADEKAAKLKAWEEENQLFLETVKLASVYRDEQENQLRELTLLVYDETKEKKPAPGVAVREITKLEYDPAEALEYAKEHGVALKLDVASFEKMVKIPELCPGFVRVRLELQATIAQDLSATINLDLADEIPVVLPNGKQGWTQ